MTELRPVRELVSFYIGGGWGSDAKGEGLEEVAIIRGADFPRVAIGDAHSVPVRWEESKKVARRALREGDLVLEISGGTKDRPTGRSVFVSEGILQAHRVPVIPASFCRLVRPDSTQVAPRYLYYWLQDMYRDGRTWGYQVQSTGLANFNVEWFLDRELVRVPPLDEQGRIAEVLGALDDLIDTNERLAAELDELFQNSWSSHFERGTEQCPRVTLGDLCATQYGHTASATTRATDVQLLRVTDINKRNWIQWDEVPNCEADQETLRKYRLNTGDLLVARMADPGKSAIVEHDVEAVFASYLVRLIPARRDYALYLFGFLKSRAFLEYSQGAMTGSVQKHMNAKVIAAAPLLSPSAEEVEKFNQIARPIRDQLAACVQEAQELRRTRDELLPLLMSGAVRVRPEGVAA